MTLKQAAANRFGEYAARTTRACIGSLFSSEYDIAGAAETKSELADFFGQSENVGRHVLMNLVRLRTAEEPWPGLQRSSGSGTARTGSGFRHRRSHGELITIRILEVYNVLASKPEPTMVVTRTPRSAVSARSSV